MAMTRTNYYFPKDLLGKVKEKSLQTGLPMAEVIRRAVSNALCEPERKPQLVKVNGR